MNTIVQAINSAGQAFVDLAIPMLVQSSVLILVLLLINLILRRRVRATFRYWIWMVVLVKLVLPPSLWSPVSIGTWFGEEIETSTIAMYEAVEAQRTESDAIPARYSRTTPSPQTDAWVDDLLSNRIERPMPIAGNEGVEPQPPQQGRETQTKAEATAPPIKTTDAQPAIVASPSNIHWQGFVLLAWAGVAIALLLLLGQRALFVKDLIAQAHNAPAALQRALDDARIQMGVKRKVRLKVSPNALSPAVCGLFIPTVLIPQNIPARLSPQDLQAVLLHELAHVRRGDLWVNLLQTLLQIVYFYNPFFWLANTMIRRVREKAVDETVLVAMGETARHYPETLLSVAKLAFTRRPALSLRLIGVVESKGTLRSRIKHILGRPLPKSAKLGIPSLLAIVLVAALLLPMAKAVPPALAVENNGPLDIRLVGVCPDGDNQLYDASGHKLEIPVDPHYPAPAHWSDKSQCRSFIFEVSGSQDQVLFLTFPRICPAGTNLRLGGGFRGYFNPSENPSTLIESITFDRQHRQPWAGPISRIAPVKQLDLTLEYFYGPRRQAICTFTGPFTMGQTVQADRGRPYELTPDSVDKESVCEIKFHFATREPFKDGDVPVVVYDKQGQRYVVRDWNRQRNATPGTHLTYSGQAVPWDEIAAITIGEEPYQATFRNIVIDYPKRPHRTYPAHYDQIAKRLNLTGLSEEELVRYNCKNNHEILAVLDLFRSLHQIRSAVNTIDASSLRADLAALDETRRLEIRQAVRHWLSSSNMFVRAYAVELGLKAGWPEFSDPALALLRYQHPTNGYETREVHSRVSLGLGRYQKLITGAQIAELGDIARHCNSGSLWTVLFSQCFYSQRPEVYDVLWDLAQDDRPWLWWPAIKTLLERRDARLRAYSDLPEKMKLRLILVRSDAMQEDPELTPKAKALLPEIFTIEMLRMYGRNVWNIRGAITTHLDREEATALYIDLLEKALQPAVQLQFERDYGSPTRLYTIVSSFIQDINQWYGLDLGQLGVFEIGAVQNHVRTRGAFEQAITETLEWYRKDVPPKPEEPTLEAQVVDTQGRPIADAIVTLTCTLNDRYSQASEQQRTVSPPPIRTNAEGRFAFQNPARAQSYYLNIEAEGFTNRQRVYVSRLPNGRFYFQHDHDRNVVVMERGSALSGRLIGLDGQPIAGARLNTSSYFAHAVPSHGSCRVNSQGRFVIDPLMLGCHVLRYGQRTGPDATGTYDGINAFRLVHVDEERDVDDVILDLRESTACLEFELLGTDGQPIQADLVSLNIPTGLAEPPHTRVVNLRNVAPRPLHRIPNLPPMKGSLSARFDGVGTKAIKVELTANQTTRVTIQLEDRATKIERFLEQYRQEASEKPDANAVSHPAPRQTPSAKPRQARDETAYVFPDLVPRVSSRSISPTILKEYDRARRPIDDLEGNLDERQYAECRRRFERLSRDADIFPINVYAQRWLVLLDWLSGDADASKTADRLNTLAGAQSDPAQSNFTKAYAALVLARDGYLNRAHDVFVDCSPSETPQWGWFAFALNRHLNNYVESWQAQGTDGPVQRTRTQDRWQTAERDLRAAQTAYADYLEYELLPLAVEAITRDTGTERPPTENLQITDSLRHLLVGHTRCFSLGTTTDAISARFHERIEPKIVAAWRQSLDRRNEEWEAQEIQAHIEEIKSRCARMNLSYNSLPSWWRRIQTDVDNASQDAMAAWVESGKLPGIEAPPDADLTQGTPQKNPKRVYLPDLETPDTNVVLDLASGEMLSAEPSRQDEGYFTRLGKGDIVYEHAQNKNGLLCLRGARLQHRTETGVESLSPDVTREAFVVYFIEGPGQRYRVCTAEGKTFSLEIISIDQGDSGGVLVEFKEMEAAPRERANESVEIVLPDADRKPVMLDLASGQLVTVPMDQVPEDIAQTILDTDQGDIVHDAQSLILVRNAASPQAQRLQGTPFLVHRISQHLPETITVTTAEGRTYEVTITAVEEQRNCTLRCRLQSLAESTEEKTLGEPPDGSQTVKPDGVSRKVVDSDGNPVAGAQVALCSETIGVTIVGGRLVQPRTSDMKKGPIVETDAQGSFRFEDEIPADCSLIAAHDSGFAQIEANDFKESGEIRLTRWGRIEGQLASGRTALEDKIWMSGLPNTTWLEHRRQFRYETLCDNDGRFVFTRVPAGRFEVGYLASMGQGASLTSRTPVEVEPGQTTTMKLGGEGRPVIGKFVPPEGYRGSIYFGQGLRSLATTRPQEPRPDDYDQMTRREQQEWHKQWSETPEAKAFYEAIWSNPNWRQYCFSIQDDGSFRIEDVIPGSYTLTVWLEEQYGGQGRPEEIGGYSGTIEVPEMNEAYSDEPLDVGELTLYMTNPLHVGDVAPLFEAKTLDDQDIRLADYRGQHVLLSFWQPVYHPELERLKTLYADYRDTRQLQIIGLGGSDTLDEVNKYVDECKIEWPQIYVGPEATNGITKQYSLPGLPYILLIDPEGKILATWLRGQKLTDTVRQNVGALKRNVSSHAGSADGDSAVDARECMKLLGLAVALYVNDHDEKLPDTLGPLEPYFSKPANFAWVQNHVTYTGKNTVRNSPKAYAVMTGYETSAHPTGQRYVTFLDGHIALVDGDRFKELTAAKVEASGDSAQTLQQLVDRAGPGSVVTIPKGTYTNPIHITKPLTLRGASRKDCVLEVTADEPAISVNTGGQGGVALENLTVRWQLASTDQARRPFALHVQNTKVVVRNCQITGMGDYRHSPVGVNLEGSPKAAVDTCHLSGFEYVVCVRDGSDAIVENCFITDCGHQGVINYSGSTMTVRRCIITGSKYHAIRCTGGTLHARDNLLIDNANRGIYLGNKTGQGTIVNNLITSNGTGISGFGGATYTIENNVIANNEYAAISMRDFCRLSIANNALTENGRGVILHKEGGQDTNQLATNLFWDNDRNVEDFDQAVTCLAVDPQFADPNGGDFSVRGPAKEQGQGLSDPEIIQQLWQILKGRSPIGSSSRQSSDEPPAQTSISGDLAWQRTDRYVAPDPKGFFPDDVEGGKRLDALFQAVDKDRRSDEEILSTVRQGFRRTSQYRTLVLRWIGNRYIWGKDPQNAEAIEIMYHAVPMERHYAIYFGLSVMTHKTPNVLRTLAEICMQGEDVGRITWGLGRQRQDIIPYIEPHLKDTDAQKREIASVLIRHFKGEVDFDQWQENKRQEAAQAQFGDRLPEFKETLLNGDSRTRRGVIDLINRNRLTPLLDDSFLPAMAAAATDEDRKVRNDVGRITGGRWVWGTEEQNADAIALMLTLASDPDREVRYNAVYYGLSVVREKSDDVIQRLIEMALVDHENNLYGRIVWGLKGPMRADPEPFKAALSEYVEPAKSNKTLAAAVDTLYRDVLETAPPAEWGLGDVSEDYPRDLFTISFSPADSFDAKDADVVWTEFSRTVPDGVVVQRMPTFRNRDSKVCTTRVRGESQVNAVKEAIEKNTKLVFGRTTPLPVSRQLYLQEQLGMTPLAAPSEPTTSSPEEGPGPIQRRINAASPGDTVTLEPGVYEEPLIIDKPLTLQGAGWEETTVMRRIELTEIAEKIQATIRQRAAGVTSDDKRRKIIAEIQKEYRDRILSPALLVTGAEGVIVRGIRFSHPGKPIEGTLASLAVVKVNDSEVRMEDCAILGAVGNGLYITDDSDVDIDRTLVAATWSTGVIVGEKSSRPCRVHVHDCDIRNNYYAGIRICPDNDQVRIERCRISGAAWHGIRYDDASPTIENNLIFGSARSGIYASGETAATIKGNLFYANEMGGMSCWFQNTDTIEGNTFADNKQIGLSILGASHPVVRRNIFYDHPTAIATGDIGDDSPSAKSDGRMNLRSNLHWANEHDAQKRVGQEMQPVTLDTKTETVKIDPQFTSLSSKDFSPTSDSPARKAGIGALDLIPFESPWPLQAEEAAIIPDGPTRDYRQWKGKN